MYVFVTYFDAEHDREHRFNRTQRRIDSDQSFCGNHAILNRAAAMRGQKLSAFMLESYFSSTPSRTFAWCAPNTILWA
jgi:hypothetical protein